MPGLSNKTNKSFIEHWIDYDTSIRINGQQDTGMAEPICLNLIWIGIKFCFGDGFKDIILRLFFVPRVDFKFF